MSCKARTWIEKNIYTLLKIFLVLQVATKPQELNSCKALKPIFLYSGFRHMIKKIKKLYKHMHPIDKIGIPLSRSCNARSARFTQFWVAV